MHAYTYDGGKIWGEKVFPEGYGHTFDFWDTFLSISFDGAFFRTTDGWENYTKPFVDTIGFAGVGKFASEAHVYAGGLNTILKSTDRGLTWNYIQPEGLEFGRIGAICPIDTNIIYAMSNQNLLKTTDGGLTWGEITLPEDNLRYWDIKFLTENYGWVTGSFSSVFKTTDGGITWIDQSPDDDYDSFMHFDALDEMTAVIASNVGSIHWTNDGGETWIEQVPKEIYPMLTDIQIVTKEVAYAVGWYGTMLKTTTGGVTWIDENTGVSTPNDFELKQNYPNPFNPATTIKYSFTSTSQSEKFVMLKVYDLLGKEIRELVSDYQSPGTYEVIFDASGIASGVYFYQLLIENKYITRKLIVLE